MPSLKLAILTALAQADSHAYAVYLQIQVEGIADPLGTDRSVYRELARLVTAGLVTKTGAKPPVYHLTPIGRRHLRTEQARALKLLTILQRRL